MLALNVTDLGGKLVRLPCKATAVLASVFLGCAIMGLALTAVFLDHLKGATLHGDGGAAGGLQERPPGVFRYDDVDGVLDVFPETRGLRLESDDLNVALSAFRVVWDSFKDARMQLIVPLSIFIGLEQGFMFADFSKVRARQASGSSRRDGVSDGVLMTSPIRCCSGTWCARWACTTCASCS